MTDQYPPPYPPPGGPGYGYGYPPPNYGPPPENNLVWAILSTVLCCLPLGIVAIVKANQVHTLWFQGFHAEAQKAAADARKWAMWSAISVGILLLLYVLFFVVLAGIGVFSTGWRP
ncbi:CD225/dispanin family protein [Amycolatopsis sp. A133]|uniref:CD225/dispanin family protein n=1 Tax=Amycolatopsis sp. A133 TaxID=3064472 RepID=UPI0027F17090|nr:CD225/dispanin family protein [Amycolatopsis sp. A133]MDQ7808216.1 CD225/dispanin family protein [Amycolatopsis sp. A133]